MPNSAKRVMANIRFRLPFTLFRVSCTIIVTLFTLCKQFQKFMYLPDNPDPPDGYSGSTAGNQKLIAQEIPADGSFVQTLMGSLSQMLDQGLSLPVWG